MKLFILIARSAEYVIVCYRLTKVFYHQVLAANDSNASIQIRNEFQLKMLKKNITTL